MTTENLTLHNRPLDDAQRRRLAMEAFVARAGWEDAELKPLAGDASFRRYERVFAPGRQAVLMDAPPEKEDIGPFVLVDDYLVQIGLSAPRILAEDREQGFLLLEDLGDDSYTRLLTRAPHEELTLYLAAVEALAEMHRLNREKSKLPAVPAYDHAVLMREVALFSDWFLPAVMGQSAQTEALGKEFLALWDSLLKAYPPAQDVAVLRDYHADNLLWLPERDGIRRVGQLDFQDALIGHAAYDLVSLLEDARRDVSSVTVQAAIAHYLAMVQEHDVESFHAYYALLGAQRNAKIIGIFVRLGVRDGKKHYTHYLPRVWRHFLHDLQHPWLTPVRDWVARNIKPEWQGAISL